MRTVLKTGLKVLNVNFTEVIWQILGKVEMDMLSEVHKKIHAFNPINTNWF